MPCRWGGRAAWGRLVSSALLSGCTGFFLSACAAPAALSRPSTTAELSALRQAVARSPEQQVNALTCEVRLRHTGAGRRYRGTLLMWLQRPDRLRLHVLGPQGSPLAYLVMGNGQVAMMDVGAATVSRAPATAAALDRLLPLAPVGLDARGWVSLLLGEVAWPDGASGRAHGNVHELFWQQEGRQMRMQLELPLGLLRRLTCEGPGQGAWSVEVASRDAAYLPAALQLTWAGGAAAQPGGGLEQEESGGAGSSELRLRDVEINPSLPPGLFTLAAPPGFAEHD